ncbi:hypothetical protein C8F04DRAFT_1235286 [Mycena alexandri]|uniref:Uncharacterized protein n=1 Tax=Mycena alexandri TaxID=1745969 RepID=A0AAD6SU57_9AGAR|nr:hypothetical protein C8F04DRAFT_1235286 [Mycena alexandri]
MKISQLLCAPEPSSIPPPAQVASPKLDWISNQVLGPMSLEKAVEVLNQTSLPPTNHCAASANEWATTGCAVPKSLDRKRRSRLGPGNCVDVRSAVERATTAGRVAGNPFRYSHYLFSQNAAELFLEISWKRQTGKSTTEDCSSSSWFTGSIAICFTVGGESTNLKESSGILILDSDAIRRQVILGPITSGLGVSGKISRELSNETLQFKKEEGKDRIGAYAATGI